MMELDDLADRLAALGEMLVFDDPNPAEAALARLDEQEPRHPRRQRLLLVAAAIAVVTVAAGLLIPDTRTAVARWFGIDGVEVKLDPKLQLPPDAPSTFDLPGPGDSAVAVVDGRRILVSAIPVRANERLMAKTVQSSTQVEVVEVNGHEGLWIAGAPHEVVYEARDGGVAVERVAANTLLWYDGDVLYRVEGFDELDDAVAFAAQGT